MSIQIPQPEIQTFTEINIGKYKTTKHYETIIEPLPHQTSKVNIVTDRNFAKSMPDYWLSYRINNRWKRITGLFKVDGTKYHKGDKGQNNVKESLILAVIDNNKRAVTIYTFNGYYSKDPTQGINLIEQQLATY